MAHEEATTSVEDDVNDQARRTIIANGQDRQKTRTVKKAAPRRRE